MGDVTEVGGGWHRVGKGMSRGSGNEFRSRPSVPTFIFII